MVIGTLPELTSLYSQSYTTDKRHAVNWTKVELMSSCLQVYLCPTMLKSCSQIWQNCYLGYYLYIEMGWWLQTMRMRMQLQGRTMPTISPLLYMFHPPPLSEKSSHTVDGTAA